MQRLIYIFQHLVSTKLGHIHANSYAPMFSRSGLTGTPCMCQKSYLEVNSTKELIFDVVIMILKRLGVQNSQKSHDDIAL